MRKLFKLITWPLRGLLFLLLVILASLNLHETTVNLFLGSQWRTPMAVLLLMAFVCGAIVGVLGVTTRRFKLNAKKAVLQPATQVLPRPDKSPLINNPTTLQTHDGL
jgi:lipopolysaccharide assembly protein A